MYANLINKKMCAAIRQIQFFNLQKVDNLILLQLIKHIKKLNLLISICII